MSSQPQISSKFSADCGDFAIQSSDDVVCFFPGAILSHMSSVFRDMFDLGKPNERTQAPIVKITEPIATLELFLTHLDPNNFKLSIDATTIEQLLQMADKYQATKILHWFEEEASVQHQYIATSKTEPAFISNHPLLVLYLASRFGLEYAGRVALRELSERDPGLAFDSTRPLDPSLYLAIHKIRTQRLERYHEWIRDLTRFGHHSDCEQCTDIGASWIFILTKHVQEKPSWESFISAFDIWRDSEYECDECGFIQPRDFEEKIERWKKLAEICDSELPEWPPNNGQST